MEVGALIRARQQIARTASTPHFAATGQGNPYRRAKLPHITAELGDIIHRVPPISRSHRSWMVISVGSPGHGVPNREEPFESLFAMRDGPLTIRNIIQLRLQHWCLHSYRLVTLLWAIHQVLTSLSISLQRCNSPDFVV
jgi:hypothetical protein